ncbi:MAG: alkaline phosphatase family protein [Anaerolineae bacterium]
MRRRILIITVDGFGPDYLRAAHTPNIDHLGATGVLTIGEGMMPSVTNVNNVSIITGTPPSRHGITANYWLESPGGRPTYMESARWILAPTVLQRAHALGLSTALLTSKRKLQRLLSTDADFALAAETPPAAWADRLGPGPGIYSPDINLWLFRALRLVLRERDPDVAYCSTTDGVMHHHAPTDEESLRHVEALDHLLGEIVDDEPNREVYLTADHGMTAKHRGVDLGRALAAVHIRARALPVIKDRYVAHHQNLGGASYVYLQRPAALADALALLRQTAGVEAAYPREEAATRFDLMPERIGDIFVLADLDTVFGRFPECEAEVNVRTHGSLHERAVPILAYGGERRQYRLTADLVSGLGLD